jgi:hypothetical protein
MRTLFLVLILGALSGFVQGRQDEPPAPARGTLAVGKDLPASINPFNATGMAKDRFHDPIGPHALDPFVLIFTTDTGFSEELKKLLKDVDNTIEKNPAVRLASCAVFVPTTLKTGVLSEDDPREAFKGQLIGLARDLDLKHVILAIDSPDNLEAFKSVLTGTQVLVFQKLRLTGQFGGEKFDAKAAADLDTFLVEKLEAKRK